MATSQSSPDKNQPPQRVCIGEIISAHGVKGLVKIRCDAEDETLLNGDVFVDESGSDTLKIQLKNNTNKFWIAEIEEIVDRDQAENMAKTKLYVGRDQLPDTNKNEFYYVDLIGLPVESLNGEPLGKIIAVENFGAGDLLEIRPPSGPTYYLPFNNATVPDIQADKLIAVIPEGLIE